MPSVIFHQTFCLFYQRCNLPAMSAGRKNSSNGSKDYYDAQISVFKCIESDDKEKMLQLLNLWEMKGDEPHPWSRQSAMHMAARHANCEVLEVLLQRKANVDIMTCWGESPLRIAVWEDHPHVVRMLLEHGADIENLLDTWLFNRDRRRRCGMYPQEHSSEIGGLILDHAASIGIRPRQETNEPVIKYMVDVSKLHMEEILYRPERRLAWREVAAISRSAMSADVIMFQQYYDPSVRWDLTR
jgi:hypothetical protein